MISILLIITITLLGNCETKNNLCQIQIYLSDQSNSINEFQFNEISKPIEIQTDTFYHAVCITNEKIRSRNMLKLVWNEADLFTNTDSFDSNDQSLIVSNETFRINEYSYLKGRFLINSNSLKSNYNLFCRFLTVNPSVYCEKEIQLTISTFSSFRFKIFIAILISLIIVGLISILVKIYFKRKSDPKKEQVETEQNLKRNDYFRCLGLNKLRTLTAKRSQSHTTDQQLQIAIPINSEPYENIEMSSTTFNVPIKSERLVI